MQDLAKLDGKPDREKIKRIANNGPDIFCLPELKPDI